MKSIRDLDGSLKELVRSLEMQGIIRSDAVKKAFLEVPRHFFTGRISGKRAYKDTPLSIGNDQTISAPHMVAIMAEELKAEPGNIVLEIGGGSGYHAAIIGKMIEPDGRLVSMERFEDMVQEARNSLASIGIMNVRMVHGDGSIGCPDLGPYDRIYYTCAAPYVPDEMFEQLKDGGVLLSVEGGPNSNQRLIRYTKINGSNIQKENLTYCVFVPLIGKYGHSP